MWGGGGVGSFPLPLPVDRTLDTVGVHNMQLNSCMHLMVSSKTRKETYAYMFVCKKGVLNNLGLLYNVFKDTIKQQLSV